MLKNTYLSESHEYHYFRHFSTTVYQNQAKVTHSESTLRDLQYEVLLDIILKKKNFMCLQQP